MSSSERAVYFMHFYGFFFTQGLGLKLLFWDWEQTKYLRASDNELRL